MTDVSSVHLDAAVTALATVPLETGSCLLAGQGHFVKLLEGRSCLDKIEIFSGHKVHQFSPVTAQNGVQFLVRGGKSVALIQVQKRRLSVVIQETVFTDWIWDCLSSDRDHVLLLTAHNVVLVVDRCLKLVRQLGCDEKCILYCGLLVPSRDDRSAVVLAGTVFSEVVIWRTRDGEVLHRLTGHDGVIFSVNYNQETGQICSTSDDRSARVWRVEMGPAGGGEGARVELVWTLYGHVARVFRAVLLDKILYTVGEDSRYCACWVQMKS